MFAIFGLGWGDVVAVVWGSLLLRIAWHSIFKNQRVKRKRKERV